MSDARASSGTALTPPGPAPGRGDASPGTRPGGGPVAHAAAGSAGLPAFAAPALDRLRFRPGVITLRPQSVADLIDGAVRTLRRRPGLFLGVGALVVVLLTVTSAAIDALFGVTLVGTDGTAGLRITPSVALSPVMNALLVGVLSGPTSQAVLGRTPPARSLLAQLRPRLPALLGFLGLLTAVALLPALAVWGAMGGRSAQQIDLLLAIGALALVGELLLLPFVAAPAVVVLEGAGPLAALRRSLALVRGSLGRTFGVLLAGRLLVLLVTTALTAPLLVALLAFETASGVDVTNSFLAPAIAALIRLVAQCLTAPFEATLRVLYYVDLRVRREALDVVLVEAARRSEQP